MFSQWRKVRLAQLGTEHHRIMHEMTFAAPIGVNYVWCDRRWKNHRYDVRPHHMYQHMMKWVGCCDNGAKRLHSSLPLLSLPFPSLPFHFLLWLHTLET
jgi:hypothetical protein